MNQVKATGQLRHCFWGTYEASIVLVFADKQSTIDVQKQHFQNWKMSEKSDKAILFHGKEEGLEAELVKLESFGGDRKKITSCAKSIDYGERFEVIIPVVPNEQLSLI